MENITTFSEVIKLLKIYFVQSQSQQQPQKKFLKICLLKHLVKEFSNLEGNTMFNKLLLKTNDTFRNHLK